jgi:thymidylate synthase (FAD)
MKVELVTQTPNPQQVIYAAMHQDYSSDFVLDDRKYWPDESKCGDIIVKRLLKGDRGHYGCLEHPAITLGCAGFPHSVIQQARTHRVGVSFDVQSFRYTSANVLAVVSHSLDIEDVFYFRPVGFYTNRQGKKYEYTKNMREADKEYCYEAATHYASVFEDGGFSEEHARDLLPFNYRQHFIVSFNARSCLHFMDLRSKKDAQLEIQQLCEQMWPHVKSWIPEIAEWYEANRLGKARLAP